MATRPHVQRRQKPGQMLSVGILLANNFTLSAFSLFVDTLHLATDGSGSRRRAECRSTILSDSVAPIRSSSGVKVRPQSHLVDPSCFDYVVVIGGILHGCHRPSPVQLNYLRRAAAAGVNLVGICTGSFILCSAGLMDQRRVCVSWLHYQEFRTAFPGHEAVGDRMFEIDGDRITCAGGAGAADLAALLAERHVGSRAAGKTRQLLQFDQSRGIHALQPHPLAQEEVDDAQVCRALLMMEQNLSEPLPILMIAGRLGLSVRQLERRFESSLGQHPSAVYRTLRIRHAHRLLETTDRSVTEIALETGFSDSGHLSRQFKALYGVPPSRMRLGAPCPGRVACDQPGSAYAWAGPRAF